MNKPEMAKKYIELGRSIIPLQANDKKPIGSWTKYQTERMTPDEAFDYFTKNPDANMGMVTGEISGISVIDIDGKEGFDALNDAKIRLPDTTIVKTPRGWHYYYKYNPELKDVRPVSIVNSKKGLFSKEPVAIEAFLVKV